MQLPLNVSPVSASFFGLERQGIHRALCVACSLSLLLRSSSTYLLPVLWPSLLRPLPRVFFRASSRVLILVTTRERALRGGMLGWLLASRNVRSAPARFKRNETRHEATLRVLLCFSLALGKIEVILFSW